MFDKIKKYLLSKHVGNYQSLLIKIEDNREPHNQSMFKHKVATMVNYLDLLPSIMDIMICQLATKDDISCES